jgi:hypothetical protein
VTKIEVKREADAMSDQQIAAAPDEQSPISVTELEQLLDDYAPDYQRPLGSKGAWSKADRDKRAAATERRDHLRKVLWRLRAAEQRDAVLRLEIDNLRNWKDEIQTERDEAAAAFNALKGSLPIMLQVATQVAAAAGVSVTGVEYHYHYRNGVAGGIQLDYWLMGLQVPVQHFVSDRVLMHGNGREEARFVLSDYEGISDARLRGLRAFHRKFDDCDYCGRRANH